jgi:hypothetical protein
MDCETFERIVVERVFSELDELTQGAAQRHVAHCSRCRAIEAGLRATREVAVLALSDPPADFTESVLSLERSARKRLPLRERFGRAVSIMAGYAMRPQLTMVALSLLMIGSSLFLLRSRPNGGELVQITERGVPEGEALPPLPNPSSVPRSAPPPSLPTGMLRPGPSPAEAMAPSAQAHAAEKVGSAESEPAERRALLAVLEATRVSGCEPQLGRLEALRARAGQSALGHEASWHAAACYAELGRMEPARVIWSELASGSGPFSTQARERLSATAN